MSPRIWFITGASRGFGRIWAEAALSRGDQVVATARKLESIADLKERFGDAVLPLALDVTNTDQVQKAVKQAHTHFGKLDIVLNNAGYALGGMVEEATLDEVRAQFDINYLGMLRVIQAVLPILRQQGIGHIIGTSSTVGHVSMPLISFYCASKWAVEGLHEGLAQEVKGFGIKVTLIEPGAYATEFGKPENVKMATGIAAYDELRQKVYQELMSQEFGNPQATAEAVLKLVDTQDPPLRLVLGSNSLPMIRSAYEARLANWKEWEEVSNAAQGEMPKVAIAAH
jgi:NADP-dependent 3-hydroxy acid dehydrogenase YdfG